MKSLWTRPAGRKEQEVALQVATIKAESIDYQQSMD